MSDITKTCTKCSKKFLVIDEEQEFLKKKQLPLPTMCPSCRQARRLAERGERTLYRTTCQECGTKMITTYNPQTVSNKILCQKCYLSYFEKTDITKS